ncbi:MAG TPA: hypothetical protein DD723_02480 [Candidatus Omnitrophica bacterium]|nr:MAG: hypothetical protein A2Z81_01800 [Omnitrophica WOR_2 bacterium GWA2_45_18]HBR14394.1 hypothetical protein [Candidatus Omnitrophota bacterium]
MSWDCKYKTGKDYCRRRRAACYPGGKRCVIYGKFEFPFRTLKDELELPKKQVPMKTAKKKKKASS